MNILGNWLTDLAHHRQTVVPPCVNGDVTFLWEWSTFIGLRNATVISLCVDWILGQSTFRDECSSYRPISLLCVQRKVLLMFLLPDLILSIEKSRPEQPGFTPVRSTMDAVVTRHLLSEIH